MEGKGGWKWKGGGKRKGVETWIEMKRNVWDRIN